MIVLFNLMKQTEIVKAKSEIFQLIKSKPKSIAFGIAKWVNN